MSRPSFQFYHGDWISNAKLRRCTHEEKGVWIDVLCLMADSDEFGIISWPLKDLAQAVGAKVSILRSLQRKGVLKGADEGEVCEAYIYVPRHARKEGEPVTLVAEQSGPIWYSSKQVRDEYIGRVKAANARTKGEQGPTPTAAPKAGKGEASVPELAEQKSLPPSPPPSPVEKLPPSAGANAPPDPVFGFGLSMLKAKGCDGDGARSFLGLMRKKYGDALVAEVCEAAKRQDVSDPIPWIRKACEARNPSSCGGRKAAATAERDFATLDYSRGF